MAIHIYCTKCYTSNGLESKSCSKCGDLFGRSRKYRVCVSFKGQRSTQVLDNLTLARETEAAIKGEMVRGEYEINHNAKKVPTLGELWAKYLPWAKENKKTWDDDFFHYRKHLEPRFGRKRLDAITGFDVDRMKMELKKGTSNIGKPYSLATIKHQMVLLKRLYNLAKRWGLYSGENPLDRVEMPKLDNLRTDEFFSDEQSDRLMKTLDSWPNREDVAFMKFTMFTGFRRGELFKLTWEDVDFDRGLITLQGPKGGKTVTIPVSSQALDVIKELDHTSTYVFPGKEGRQKIDFRSQWLRIRKAAGLPDSFRFHGLRHNFASTLVSNGMDLLLVQKLLTHKDAKTTQRYAHLAPGTLKEAAQRSGELMSPEARTDNVIKLTE